MGTTALAKELASYSLSQINASGRGKCSVFANVAEAVGQERHITTITQIHRWWHEDRENIQAEYHKQVSSSFKVGENSDSVDIDLDEYLFEPDIKLIDSPFYTLCFEMYISVKNEIDSVPGTKNENYCPDYVTDVFLKRYAPIIPMWTEVLRKERGQDFLSTSAEVEEYYKILDEDVMNHAPNVRVQKYIEQVGEYVHTTLKKINLCVQTKPLTKSQRTKKGNERPHLTVVDASAVCADTEDDTNDPDDPADDPNLEDGWLKRVKNPHSHLNLLHTRKLLDQSQSTKAGTEAQDNVPETQEKSVQVFDSTQVGTGLQDTVPESKENIVLVLESTQAGTEVQDNVPKTKENTLQVPDSEAWRAYLSDELVKFVDSMSARADDTLLYLYGKSDHPLYFSSVQSLLLNGRLRTSVVDTWLYILRKKTQITDIYISSSAMAGMIFNQDVINFDLSRVCIGQANMLLFPLLRSSHWWLISCDMKNKTLASYNGSTVADELDLLEKFLSFLESWGSATVGTEWRILETEHFKQPDSVSCGVYMLWRIRNIVEGSTSPEQLNTTRERCKIATECLEFSHNGTFGELSFTSSDEMLLPNGLVNNISYYNASGNAEIDSIIISVISGQPPVRVEDFRQLLENRWLTGPSINAILMDHCKNRDDILLIPTLEAPKIFDRNSNLNKKSFLITSPLKEKTLIIPLHVNSNHWCLVVADIKSKKYTYLDPMHPADTEKRMDSFLNFLRRRNTMCTETVVTTGWTVVVVKDLPSQTDSNNCGIFVCAYAIAYLQNDLPNLVHIDCNEKRVQYAREILTNAACCKHLCISCGLDEFKKCRTKMSLQEMVQCNTCKRWVHMWPCLKYLKLKPQEIRSSEYTFQCKLCQLNGKLLQQQT
ncbi:hypothetical protein ONE63_007299 [Megalurothrips usitatus]|uniref:Ubiquitin-like protease family profile domain-containing protein n=1 Tax=Megalurothrips usitatus TaxID=439358 RepID=A0AAV7XVQ9_9NEOP|nr:hypothetical protein ONE63_007299 [Megalurothrips usitatus]